MEPKGSLSFSQQPATDPHLEPDESNAHLSTPFLFSLKGVKQI
jgi:hypothetical protein